MYNEYTYIYTEYTNALKSFIQEYPLRKGKINFV